MQRTKHTNSGVKASNSAHPAADQLISIILKAALKAPSAHNTQPWQFKVVGDQIEVYVNWSRHLHVSDPTTRQLYISLGCALANAQIAAHGVGFRTEVDLLPDSNDQNAPAATITLALGNSESLGDTKVAAIDQRHTDRSLYDQKPLTQNEKAALKTASDDSVFLIKDKARIKQCAILSAAATVSTLSDDAFKGELSHWIRNNWTRKPDGMPGYASGIPGPVSLIAPLMVRFAPIHKQEAPKVEKEVLHSSAIAVIATKHDTTLDWLRAGMLLETIWLEAVATGLAAMPLAAAIESDNGTQRQQIADLLETSRKPQAILRLGHSANGTQRSTPRRTLQDCVQI